MNRRTFVKMAALAAVATSATPVAAQCCGAAAPCGFRTKLRKALIRKRLTPEVVAELKDAGFDGVELTDAKVTLDEARAARDLAIRNGITIHSFMGAWFKFNEPELYAAEVERAKAAIRLTAAYGASVMLIVPSGGWKDDVALPPWKEIKPTFNPETLEMTAAVKGDNAPYAGYIAKQNNATRCAIRAMNELIPVAAAEGVILAIENVGNRYWLSPEFSLALVRKFRSPWVKYYFDLGNQTNISMADGWLRVLGPEIVKLHIKDEVYDTTRSYGTRQVPIGKGILDFKSIRRTIEEIGYNGWVSIESSGWTEREHAAIMDKFFAGTL